MKLSVLLLSLATWLSTFAVAAPENAPANETAALLVELIRINTSNPPGQEGKMAELLAQKLRPLGFEIDIIPTPAAGNLTSSRGFAAMAARSRS